MSQPVLQKPLSPLQLRDELETMVLKELLGPGRSEEEIIESPGTRYFVGVLAPRKRAARSVEHEPPQSAVNESQTTVPDDDDDEADNEVLDGDELALGGKD